MENETYTTKSTKNGTFFFTSCGHTLFSIKDKYAYDGCLCPACLNKGIMMTLRKFYKK